MSNNSLSVEIRFNLRRPHVVIVWLVMLLVRNTYVKIVQAKCSFLGRMLSEKLNEIITNGQFTLQKQVIEVETLYTYCV